MRSEDRSLSLPLFRFIFELVFRMTECTENTRTGFLQHKLNMKIEFQIQPTQNHLNGAVIKFETAGPGSA